MGATRLARPANSAMMGVAVMAGITAGAGAPPTDIMSVDRIASLYLASVALVASIMVVNDIVDLEVDRVNAPWRPIPSGLVAVDSAWRMAFALALSSVGLALYVDLATGVLAVLMLSMGNLYNVWAKRRGLLGNLVVASLVSFPIIYGGLASSLNLRVLLFALMVFLAVLGREVAKGIVDVEGDRAGGVATLAVAYGRARAALLASSMYILAVAVSLIPLALGLVNRAYYSLIILPVDAAMVAEAVILLRRPDRETAYRHKNRVLVYMGVALAGLMAGSLG